MRVCVIVPTTDGPAPILRLARLAQAPRSVMRTQDDYRPLPPSSRYHAFVHAGGALADRLGHGAGQFELRLGAAVETGRSWELPVAIAHWLQGKGCELTAEAPDLVIWATGVLDNDLNVLRRDYHLESKLQRSVGYLRAALGHGARVCMLLPDAVEVPAALDLSWGVHHRIADFGAAQRVLEGDLGFRRQQAVSKTAPAEAVAVRGRGGVAKLAGGSFLIGLTAFLVWMVGDWQVGQYEDTGSSAAEPVTTETAPRPVLAVPLDSGEDVSTVPRLVLDYAPEGEGCPAVLFSSVVPDRQDLEPEGNAYPAISWARLCGIGFQLPDAASSAVDIDLPQPLITLVLPSDRHAQLRLLPGETQMLRLRAGQPDAFETEIGVTLEPDATRSLSIVVIP